MWLSLALRLYVVTAPLLRSTRSDPP
jgi:hypothetical protein